MLSPYFYKEIKGLIIFIAIASCLWFLISVLLLYFAVKYYRQGHKRNIEVDKENQLIDKQNKLLQRQNVYYEEKTAKAKQDYNFAKNKLEWIQNNIDSALKSQEDLTQSAFENYCIILEQNYEDKENEYNNRVEQLHKSYENIQNQIIQSIDEAQKDLDKIQATRAAALNAQLKEKEIKDKLSFYCLSIKETDLDDIKILERMKNQLHNPRILSMLIWSTYFQKPMTTLCNNVLGVETKCGIYKITNQNNNMCYIGQSNDISRRWKEHAKCGLGIDTPQRNKLYQAMIEDGLWNFSFELLEECPKEQLNEKEFFYINLYQSSDYGYNSAIGITKKGD